MLAITPDTISELMNDSITGAGLVVSLSLTAV